MDGIELSRERDEKPIRGQTSDSSIILVHSIPPIDVPAAIAIERIELDYFVLTLRSLPDEAWHRPVANSKLTVHGLVSSVAGVYSSQRSFVDFVRQFDPRLLRAFREPGESVGQVMHRIHTGKRIGHEPSELIEELILAGPRAISTRAHWPFARRPVSGQSPGMFSLPGPMTSPFTVVRWLWARRLELCDAAGIGFDLHGGHDDRILELVLKAAGERGAFTAGARAIDIRVREFDDLIYRFGGILPPVATISIEFVTLVKLAARMRSPAGARERAEIEGEVLSAMRLFRAIHGD